MNLKDYPHRRYNPLLDEWVLCSPHRTKRPWQGATEPTPGLDLPHYDSACYLCPGNERAGGQRNPGYNETFVFTNDFAALLPDSPMESLDEGGIFRAQGERGICKVICFSPRHDLTLARMGLEAIQGVVEIWADEWIKIGSNPDIGYVQIFENRGAVMGCSNPHPHCQIWASSSVPDIPAKEGQNLSRYLREKSRCLLCDYLQMELSKGERIILHNDSFVALVPFWAVWPFETMVLPRRHVTALCDLTEKEKRDLAEIMKRLGTRYDNLFQTDFPYSMGIHQRPSDAEDHPEWHFHLHYMPPLLRSATVKKFMVGYELLSRPQRDITAESAAELLSKLSDTHYRER